MKIKRIALGVAVIVGLSACGGGGSSMGGTGASEAEGLWRGTTNDNRTVAGLVLDDGTYWFVYTESGNSEVIAGLVQGNSTSRNGDIVSSNGRDFNLEGLGVRDFSLQGSYVSASNLATEANYAASDLITNSFATYDSSYELSPSLNDIAGTYSGPGATSGGVDFSTLTISNSGVIEGLSELNCGYSGSVVPRSRGNVYDVSVTYNGGTCVNGTNTVSGVAYFDAVLNRITSAALNSERTDGFIFIGTKQPD